jgi:hypothetical protein
MQITTSVSSGDSLNNALLGWHSNAFERKR